MHQQACVCMPRYQFQSCSNCEVQLLCGPTQECIGREGVVVVGLQDLHLHWYGLEHGSGHPPHC